MGYTVLRIGEPITVRRSAAVVGVALLAGLAGCGSTSATGTTPATPPPTTAPLPPSQATEPCGRPVTATTAAVGIPATAALQSATIIVDPQTAAPPRCVQLAFGQTVHLHLGDRAEFVANQAPQLMPPNSDAVQVTTRPGPTAVFGGLTTQHVIVTLTAVHAGTVSARWIDCNGTGC